MKNTGVKVKMCKFDFEKAILKLLNKSEKIEPHIQEQSNNTPISVEGTTITAKTLWGDTKYKFLEKTIWDSNKKICVALGFNPTNNEINKIDSTNKKIIEQLGQESFGGYYLLNLYPQRSDGKNDFDESDEIGEIYNNLIPKILELILKSEQKLLIFFGRTVAVRDKIITKLNILKEKDKLMMTIKKETALFYHPARVEIKIVDVANKYYETTYHIVGSNEKEKKNA